MKNEIESGGVWEEKKTYHREEKTGFCKKEAAGS